MRSRAVTRWGLAYVVAAALLTALAGATAQEGAASAPLEDPTATRPTSQPSPGRLMEALGLSWPSKAAPAPGASPDTTADIRVSRPGTFEIHVQGADLRGVLQLLSTQGHRNIVATKEVTGTVTADLYGVTFTEALEAVLKASGYVYREKDGFIHVYTPQQLAEVIKSERVMGRRVFQLAYITAADARTLIAPVLSSDAKISTTPAAEKGVPTSGTDTGGNSNAHNDILIVQDYEDNLKQVEAIINDVDVRPDQVLVEVTMLSATLDEDNALGVNFSTLAGVDFETLGSSSTDLGNMGKAGLSGTKLSAAPAAGFRTDFTTTSGGMTVGLVTNNVAAFITALESFTDTTILANPKLLIVNKQRGEVMIGAKDGYITTTVTEGQVTQSVEFLETGTKLVVRPYVAKDGFIRLELHPEDSDGGVTVTGQLALPSETTTELTTNILVRDGHTVVLGGLFREQTVNTRSQVPLLGNLPGVGAAFRYTKDETKRKEILILITPHIIKQVPDEAVSEQLKDDMERYRIGQRKGVRWWGRDRLAQTYMNWARQALSRGNRGMAMWNVDMALSLESTLEEAIRLKERLSGRPYWSDYAQDSAVKYVVQRMIMQDLGRPTELVIPPGKPRRARSLDKPVQDAFGMADRVELPLGEPTPSVKEEDDTNVGNDGMLRQGP
jgi:type IV pilus assembly protein PilQ